MASYDIHAAAPAKLDGLMGALRGLVSALADWNETRLTREILGRLSDRELADIGLTRGEIAQISLRLPRR